MPPTIIMKETVKLRLIISISVAITIVDIRHLVVFVGKAQPLVERYVAIAIAISITVATIDHESKPGSSCMQSSATRQKKRNRRRSHRWP